MNQSRKKRSRGKIRRRRQLREESERIASRQKEEYTKEAIPIRLLFKKYIAELLMAAFVIFGVVFVISLGSDKKAVQKLQESFDPLLYDRSLEWDATYSQGYKIIVFTEKNIIHTSYDTLSDDLEINWKEMSVTRIQADQLSGTIEKIKIAINGITYAPANVLGMTATVILSRQKGASARLAKFGNLEFVAKIVADDSSQLFFLLGLRNL